MPIHLCPFYISNCCLNSEKLSRTDKMKANKKSLFFWLILMFSSITYASTSYSASFQLTEKKHVKKNLGIPAMIFMEGDIVSGDYKKLLNILTSHENIDNFPIAKIVLKKSNGGNLREAMKIGSLINELYMTVLVLEDCYSACSFIALSAKQRGFIGNLGLHRPYFDQSLYSKLTPKEAENEYKKLHKEATLYLLKNYVSQEVIDKMFSYPSDDMWVVSSEESRDIFGTDQPAFQEWIKAQCDSRECEGRLLYETQVKSHIDLFERRIAESIIIKSLNSKP